MTLTWAPASLGVQLLLLLGRGSRRFCTQVGVSQQEAFQEACWDPVALSSVAKVFTTHSSPDYMLPWQLKPQRESTGSAFVVGPRQLLTNAHVVADASALEVQRHGSGERFPARVVAAGHSCDLALVEVDSPAFWASDSSPPPLPLPLGSEMPRLREQVLIAGFPGGGGNADASGGVVSRLERVPYAHAGCSLLAVQVDTSVHQGSSGGPALRGGKVVRGPLPSRAACQSWLLH